MNLINTLQFGVILCSFFSAFPTQAEDETTPKPKIYSMHITSDIKYRYAQTLISSRVANPANVSQETLFHVVLPDTAFITGFVMVINEKEYKAYVKEKEEAKQIYTQAVLSGQSAAHVEYSFRDSNQFTVSMNIEPQSKIVFNLTYEELLDRSLHTYKNEININPGQIVDDLRVKVEIEESLPIINLKVPDLKITNEIKEVERDNELAKITLPKPNKAIIEWNPTASEQKEMRDEGIKGQFIVNYDVDRSSNPQEILVNDGYFVHFFANDDLHPLSKHVIFIIDLSGSMHGRKLHQVKEAMNKILSDLRSDDYFSLVLFSDIALVWAPNEDVSFQSARSSSQELTNKHIVPINNENLEAVKKYVDSLADWGGTNIIAGLRKGIKLTKIGQMHLGNLTNIPEPMIIFLTDGQPNVEMSDPKKITETATELNTLRSPIFSLGFGDGADMEFLKNLSLANSAYARNIYEGADATLQLNNFFKEVSSPLLSNVTFKYPPEQVENGTTNIHFDTFFSGSEMVVVGKLTTNALTGSLTANSFDGFKEIPFTEIKYIVIDHIPESPIPQNRTYGHLERMWAYKTVNQLLNKYTVEQKDSLKNEALEIALKYSFVTPITSLVVVKPNDTMAVDAQASHAGVPDIPYANLYSPLSANIPGSLSVHLPAPLYSAPPRPQALPPTSTQYDVSDRHLLSGPFSGQGFFSSNRVLASSVLQKAPGHSGGAFPTSTYPTQQLSVDSYSELPEMEEATDSAGQSNSTFRMPTLKNYTEVQWLADPTPENIIIPPMLVSTKYVISLNETSEGQYNCSVNSQEGQCTHFVHCILDNFIQDVMDFLPYKCLIEPMFLGVCCPTHMKN